MHKSFLRAAALLGALSVALGAFGSHTLKELVSEKSIITFETGVRYQFYHVLALAFTGILYKEFPNKWLVWTGDLFLLGMLFFSGSLYLLTFFNGTLPSGLQWIGIITPFGGLLFILGWFCLLRAIVK